MKHRTSFALVVAAAAVLAGSVAASPGNTSSQTLSFVGVNRTNVLLSGDGSNAPRVGARLIFVDTIVNRVAQFGMPAGAKVGRAEGVCTIVSVGSAQCSITAHVPSGELVMMGSIRLTNGPSTDQYAVVGGAGAYGGARGTVTSKSLSKTKTLVLVRLTA